MKCYNCGFENQDGSVFCNMCGTRLSSECPNCRKPVPSGSRFCNYCGQSLFPSDNGNSKPEKHPAERRSIGNIFSFRRIGSVLVIVLSILYFILTVLGIDEFDGATAVILAFYLALLYFGIRGINAKSTKYGILSIILATVVFIISLIGVYNYNDMVYYSSYKMSYSGPFLIYIIMLLPSVFMCITPRSGKPEFSESGSTDDGIEADSGDEEVYVDGSIFYCTKCGAVLYCPIDSSIEDFSCPKCGAQATKTSTTYGIWRTLSNEEKNKLRNMWSK